MAHVKVLAGVTVLAVALLLSWLLAWQPQPVQPLKAEDRVPDELLGFTKWTLKTGEEAIGSVKKKHVGDIREDLIEDLAIIHYFGEAAMFTLWVTLYPNASVAESELQRMAEAMVRYGGDWAETLTTFTLDNLTVYQVSPQGRDQYFWTEEEWGFYLLPENLTKDQVIDLILAI